METVATYFFTIVSSVFWYISVIMGFLAPLFSFVAYRDLKDGRRLPWVVHLAGFFGLFTFVADVAIFLGNMKPEELTVYIQVPAFAGVFLLWLSGIYVLITREQWK